MYFHNGGKMQIMFVIYVSMIPSVFPWSLKISTPN